MSIDLLPFSAFALESCAAPAPAPGEGQTLTLQLRRMAREAEAEAMAGLLSLRPSTAPLPGSRHVGMAAVEAAPVTITFAK